MSMKKHSSNSNSYQNTLSLLFIFFLGSLIFTKCDQKKQINHKHLVSDLHVTSERLDLIIVNKLIEEESSNEDSLMEIRKNLREILGTGLACCDNHIYRYKKFVSEKDFAKKLSVKNGFFPLNGIHPPYTFANLLCNCGGKACDWTEQLHLHLKNGDKIVIPADQESLISITPNPNEENPYNNYTITSDIDDPDAEYVPAFFLYNDKEVHIWVKFNEIGIINID